MKAQTFCNENKDEAGIQLSRKNSIRKKRTFKNEESEKENLKGENEMQDKV